MRRVVLTVSVLTALAAPASAIEAPFGISWCPAGDLPYTITNWTYGGTPVVNGLVFVYAEGLGETFALCEGDSATFSARTDASGAATLTIYGGGVTPGISAKVWVINPRPDASNTPTFIRSYVSGASPDQNGDLVVDDTDRALFLARMITAVSTVDLNADLAATQADVAIFEAHFGHTCPATTATRAGTWGRIKSMYR